MLTPLPPLNSMLDRVNLQSYSPDRSNSLATNLPSSPNKGLAKSHSSPSHRDNFAVFNEVLQKAYQRMVFSPIKTRSEPEVVAGFGSETKPIPGYQQVDRISPDQAAGTILGFIKQRIKLDKAAGASQEELLSILDEGLKGFIKGFNEAQDIIEGMGLLTPQLSKEIGETYNRVIEGVDKLQSIIKVGSDIERPLVNSLTMAAKSLVSEKFSLELTTQDGDKVSIDISRSAETNIASKLENTEDSSTFSVSQQKSSSNRFNLSINGELDEEEMLAINQLLEGVNQISVEFFEGDLDAAFNLALELNFDRQALSSLNLELKKSVKVQAIVAYESTSQIDTNPLAKYTVSPLVELNSLLDNVQKILDEARVFAEPIKLLDDISSYILSDIRENQKYPSQNEHVGNRLNEMLYTLVNKFDL